MKNSVTRYVIIIHLLIPYHMPSFPAVFNRLDYSGLAASSTSSLSYI